MLKIMKKGKILFALMLLASLVTGIMVPAGAALADPPVGYQAALTTAQHTFAVNVGDNFDIPITVDSGTNQVMGFQVALTWSGTAVNCTGADFGSYMPAGIPMNGVPAAGTTDYWGKFLTGAPVTGSGLAITFHFQAASSGTVTINYAAECFVDDNTGTHYPNLYTDGDINVAIGLPDLAVTGASTTWVTPGSTYTVTFTVENLGDTPLFDNYDYEILVDGVTHDASSGAALAAGASEPITTSLITLGVDGLDTVTMNVTPLGDDADPSNHSLSVIVSLLTMGIEAPASAAVGASFDANVTVSTGTSQTRGAEAVINFDPAILECTGVSEGTFYSDWAAGDGAITQFFAGSINNTTGTISGYSVGILGGTNPDQGPSGDGNVMVLHLKAKAASAGSIVAAATGSMIDDVNGDPLPGLSLKDDTIIVTAPTYYNLVITQKAERVEVNGNQTVFFVDYTVKNIGNKATANTFDCAVLVNGQLIDVEPCAKLNGGAEAAKSVGPFPIPAGNSATISVEADYYNNNPAESNENDNTLTNTLDLSLPDYIVAEKYEVETAPGLYTITYTIKNIGGGDATVASTTVVKVDGTTIDSRDCPALVAGQSSGTVIITGVSLSSVNDVVLVVADADDEIVESNENNNERGNTYSPGNVDNDTEIVGSVVAQIEITCPYDIIDFALNLGENTVSGVLNVKSNGTWQVEVSDENGVTHGHMTMWNGVSYGVSQLTDPMEVACVSEGKDIPLPGPGLIASGDAGGQFLDEGENFDIDFIQVVYFSDQVEVYRILVTFTAGITF